MKCEICHKADAATAITRQVNGEEDELYVCKACAAAERKARQKKSQRTRKVSGLPPGMSITVSGSGEAPPPIIGAILDAVHGMVSDLEQAEKEAKDEEKKPEYHDFPCDRVESSFRLVGRLHLEGLHLIGELDAVKRAVRALRMELVGIDADGVPTAGHAFALQYQGSSESAKRVVEDLITQERNARVRLFEEMPRVFGDSLCRALAILKNCRLLAPGEFFDLLSPLRLAALEGMLDGIDIAEIERLIAEIDLTNAEDKQEQPERDKVDAARADEMNEHFEDVVLNERAEEKFL